MQPISDRVRPRNITNGCSQPSAEGPDEYFTGDTRIDPLFDPEGEARAAASVTFEPIEEIRAGDVVWFPPDEKHWHGACPEKAMTHIAIQEQQDGEAVTWLEHVTDEEYDSE